jgi:ribosomal protein L17
VQLRENGGISQYILCIKEKKLHNNGLSNLTQNFVEKLITVIRNNSLQSDRDWLVSQSVCQKVVQSLKQ